MSSQPRHLYTLEEYFALEKSSKVKYEYWNGEVFAMSGASLNHNRIVADITGELHTQLKNRRCEILPSDMRVKVPTAGPYRYPDVVVACGDLQIETIQGLEMLVNPILIVEVLSPTTEDMDKGRKFDHYRSIEFLQEYLLIAQEKVHVMHYIKQSPNFWTLTETQDISTTLTFPSINCTLALSEVYRRVKFDSVEKQG